MGKMNFKKARAYVDHKYAVGAIVCARIYEKTWVMLQETGLRCQTQESTKCCFKSLHPSLELSVISVDDLGVVFTSWLQICKANNINEKL